MSYEDELIESKLCPEIVMHQTEDGPVDGRCLQPITDDEIPACPMHAVKIRAWRAETEAEMLAWERELEERY